RRNWPLGSSSMFAAVARGEKRGTSLAALAIFAFAGFALAANPVSAAEPAYASAPDAAVVRLFGTSENVNGDISPFPKWTDMLARYASERHLEDAPCTNGRCALQRWKAFVMTLKGQDRMRQLEAVNDHMNRFPYRSDYANYGVEDYWATPREFFANGGD